MNGYYYKIYFTGAGGINMFQIVQVITKFEWITISLYL